jgi:hypothetical protein
MFGAWLKILVRNEVEKFVASGRKRRSSLEFETK